MERFLVGEYIQDEMNARSWNSRDLARKMGGESAIEVQIDMLTIDLTLAAIDAPEDHAIHQTVMAESTADKLAKAFGTSSEVWRRLDRASRTTPPTTEEEDG